MLGCTLKFTGLTMLWGTMQSHAHSKSHFYRVYTSSITHTYVYIIHVSSIHIYIHDSIRGIQLSKFTIHLPYHALHTPSSKADSEVCRQPTTCIYTLSHYLAILRTTAYSPHLASLYTPSNSCFCHAWMHSTICILTMPRDTVQATLKAIKVESTGLPSHTYSHINLEV